MVDDVRLARLLRALATEVSALHAESGASPQRRADPMWLRGVKFAFVTAIEALVDISQHACASQGWGPPKDNGHAVLLLGEHGVLPVELAARLRQAVGFRNVLVHEYVDVDDAIVVRRLTDLSDLDDALAALSRLAR